MKLKDYAYQKDWIKELIESLDNGGLESLELIVNKLIDADVVSNCHVGTDNEWTKNHIIEWYLGQMLIVLESKAYHCVNSLINYGMANIVDAYDLLGVKESEYGL